jgi:hypothetical protein
MLRRRLHVIACDKREAFAQGSVATQFRCTMDCFASLAMTACGRISYIVKDALYRLAAIVMLTCGYDENRKSPRPADRAES